MYIYQVKIITFQLKKKKKEKEKDNSLLKPNINCVPYIFGIRPKNI